MTIKLRSHLQTYFKHHLLFILIFCAVLFLEFNGNNHQYFVSLLHGLNEHNLQISDGELFGFNQTNNTLISQHNDPNITFNAINDRVRYITIQCANPNPEALCQVFYRRAGQVFTENRSLTFPLRVPKTTIRLPRTINVTSLRIDLTHIEGDVLSCEGFILNPKAPFEVSYVRLALLFFSLVGLIWGNKIIPQKVSNAAWDFLIDQSIWIFIVLSAAIGLVYSITITFDSGHYLWLADLIRMGEWASWDPIRNIGFPLLIFLSLALLGHNQFALLIPMILAHTLLFVIACELAFLVLKPIGKYKRFFITCIIFVIIAFDPTVFGYYHTLLTEYVVATIAMLSCFVGVKLYQSPPFSKKFFLLSSYFLIMVPISWHIKQPYIGAALFPLCIATFLILLQQFSWKKFFFSFSIVALVIGFTLSSNFAWDSFLTSQGNPLEEDRHISTYTERRISSQFDQDQQTPITFTRRQISHYLENINFFLRYSTGEERRPNLAQGFQNTIIAHRMYFSIGETNILFNYPVYNHYVANLQDHYAPPISINQLFTSRANTSHFFFTVSYLLLPIYLPIIFIVWLRKKDIFSTASLILGGTSLLNTLIHLFTNPIDRYLFLGYPLNLLIFAMILIQVIWKFKAKITN